MDSQWDYPIYLIALGGGYASIFERGQEGEETQAVVVCTNEDLCERFMARHELQAQPKAMKNSREFVWLLQNLKLPVTRVAFDPAPDDPNAMPRWSVAIAELLKELVIDFSPWNYPVFVVAQGNGFASIESEPSDREKMRAVALFTDPKKATTYLEAAGETGSVTALKDLGATRALLQVLAADANAVALDPVVQDGKRTAKHCFEITTVLNKYLVQQ